MSYLFELGDLLLPVTPESVSFNISNQNTTINLIDETEFNFIKPPGLTEATFDARIPAFPYPFARYKNGVFLDQKYFREEFMKLKNSKKAFMFSISRELPSGKGLYDTKMLVSLEEYTIKEDAGTGFDITISVTLKQYIEHLTSIANISEDGKTATIEKTRESENAPSPVSNEMYTVKSGDTLWAIAKYYYNDGSKYTLLADANPDIVNPNLIYPGQTLMIPKQQED